MKVKPLFVSGILALTSILNVNAFAVERKQAAPVTISDTEVTESVKRLAPPRKLDLGTYNDRLLDGVKGYVVPLSSNERGSANHERSLQKASYMLCDAMVFGLVELVDSKSFVGSNGAGVYTKYQFRMVKDWREGMREAGKIVNLISLGGEAMFNGEPVRVENSLSNYKRGQQYILFGGRRSECIDVIYGSPPFLEVQNGVIYPGPGWSPFESGTSIKEARKLLDEAVKKRGDCK